MEIGNFSNLRPGKALREEDIVWPATSMQSMCGVTSVTLIERCSSGSVVAADTTRSRGKDLGRNKAFDGDTASFIAIYTDAKEDIIKYLDSKQAYVDPIGGIRTSASVVTVDLFLRSFTGHPEH